MKKTSRRSFLKHTAVGAGVLALPLNSYQVKSSPRTPVASTRTLRLIAPGLIWQNRPWLVSATQELVSDIMTQSQGALAIEITFAPEFWQNIGAYDGIISSPSLWKKDVPAFLGNFPVGFSAEEKWLWLQSKPVQSAWVKSYQEVNRRPILLGVGESLFGIVSTHREITSHNLKELTFAQARKLTHHALYRLKLKSLTVKAQDTESSLINRQVNVSEVHSLAFWQASNLINKDGFFLHYGALQSPLVYELVMKQNLWRELSSAEKSIIQTATQKVGRNLIKQCAQAHRQEIANLSQRLPTQKADFLTEIFQGPNRELAGLMAEKNATVRRLLNADLHLS